jgi:S1-C subfamily serine protease
LEPISRGIPENRFSKLTPQGIYIGALKMKLKMLAWAGLFVFNLSAPAESALAKAGLRKNDVNLSINGEKTADTAALLRQAPALPAGKPLKIVAARDQMEIVIQLNP